MSKYFSFGLLIIYLTACAIADSDETLSSKTKDFHEDPIFSELIVAPQSENVSPNEKMPRFMAMVEDYNRGKRGVLELSKMISCATGCNPLSYQGYGCYCGYLGDGPIMDGVDKCCHQHDICYENSYCKNMEYYLFRFDWRCNHGNPYCVTNEYDNRCSYDLCQCDVQLAKCLKQYRCPDKHLKPGCRVPRANFFDGIKNMFGMSSQRQPRYNY